MTLNEREIGLIEFNQFVLSTRRMIEALDAAGLIGEDVVGSSNPSEEFVNRTMRLVDGEIEELARVWSEILQDNPRYLDVGLFWLADASFVLKMMNSPTWQLEGSRLLPKPDILADLKEMSTWITIFVMSSLDLFVWGFALWWVLRNPQATPEKRREISITVWNSCATTIVSMGRLEALLRKKMEELSMASERVPSDDGQGTGDDALVN